MRTFSIALVLVFILSSCQREQYSADVDKPSELSEEATSAIENLSGRLGAEPQEIVLVREENVVWRDGSLGRPKKDVSYTQALVEGKLIVLRHDDSRYEYHSRTGQAPFYCPAPATPANKVSVE